MSESTGTKPPLSQTKQLLQTKVGALPESKALAEAQAGSLGELFSRDPETLSEGEIDKIWLEFRAQRARFAQAELDAQNAPKKARSASTSGRGVPQEQQLVGIDAPTDLGI